MAVQHPKRPCHAGPSSHPHSDHPPPVTPTDLQPMAIICELWMVCRKRQASQTYHLVAPPLLVLPGRQRFTQTISSSSRHSLAQDQSHLHSPSSADPPDHDPFITDEPLFSNFLYEPDGPINLPHTHLSGLQKKQNQWQRWSQEVIPSLIEPYLAYCRNQNPCNPTLTLVSSPETIYVAVRFVACNHWQSPVYSLTVHSVCCGASIFTYFCHKY